MTDPDQVGTAAAATLDQLGAPDLVTVTAGVGHGGTLLDTPDEDWDRVIGTNAKGVWLAMRAMAGPMLDAGGGSIVVTSSVSPVRPDRGMGLYCASKATLDLVVRVAAAEWAPSLPVNAVAPGVTDTAMPGPARPRATAAGWPAWHSGRRSVGWVPRRLGRGRRRGVRPPLDDRSGRRP